MHHSRILSLFVCGVLASLFVYGGEWVTWDQSKPGTAPSIQVLSSDASRARLQITLHGFWLETVEADGMVFQQPVLPGEEFLRETGKPQMPGIGRLLAVPDGRKVVCRILEAQPIEYGGCMVFPAQQKPNRCEDTVFPFTMDQSLYETDAFFPGGLVTVGEPGVLRDYRIVRIACYPLQFNPVHRTLEIYPVIDAEFTFEYGDTRAAILNPSLGISPTFANLYQAAILNYPFVAAAEARSRSVREYMLVFVADALESGIADFVQWKRQCGLVVTVRRMSEVGNTVTQIKAAIQSAYDNPATRPSFVVFVGDENTIVPDHRSTSNGNAASDYPYTLLSGEAGDIDPDLVLGRIVGANLSQIAIQFDKIIHYEKNPDAGGTWYKKCAGIASNEGSNPSDVEYITFITDTLLAHTYNYRDHWFQGEGTATATNINAGLTDGRSWLTYIGHGSGTSWGSTNTTYNNNSIDGMSNGYKMPILVDVACENGSFDDATECFGEKWMRAGTVGSPKGAVGYYGGSVSISWNPPAIMAEGIALHHFQDPVYTWGGSCLAGQMYLKAQSGSGADTIDNFEWFILFGDPSLMIRTDTPKSLQVVHDENIVFGQTEFDVTVTLTGGTPVAGARVYAYSSAESSVKAFALTDATGDAHLVFAVPPAVDGTLQITVTGYNLQTYLGSAAIVPAQPCDAPTNFAVANAGDNDVVLTWDASPHADGGYRIYRSTADCGGTFEWIDSVTTGNSYHDLTVSGGMPYSYKIKSVCGGYGGITYTSCQNITAIGDCFLAPSFDGLQSIDAPMADTCQLVLHWQAGSSNCSAYPTVRYWVYRATASGGPYSVVASGLTGTSFTDEAVQSGQNYFYRVRATDAGGNEDPNTIELASTPLGPLQIAFADDMEGTEPNGWSHAAAVGTDDWHYATAQSHSPSHAWLASDANVPKDSRLVTPAFAVAPAAELSFWHRYTFENGNYDGGVLEISTDGGVTFNDLGPHILLNGYTGTLSSSYQNPIGGRQAWTNSSGAWKEVQVDLGAYAGQTVKIRFRIGCDTSVGAEGWYIDDVVVSQSEECQSNPGMLGDLNDDQACDTQDLVILSFYLSGMIQHGEGGFSAPLERADLDQDGLLRATDLVHLLKMQ